MTQAGKNIIWLASYPKSGNTWLRLFLANLTSDSRAPYDINQLRRFGYSDARASLFERVAGRPLSALSQDDLHRLRPAVHRMMAGDGPGAPVFVKTHNAIAVDAGVATITPEVTRGAIYVVRNPLDVVVSYANHFALDIDRTIDLICHPDNMLLTRDRSVFSYLGDWSTHVRSWTAAPGLAALVIRYEDMLDRPTQTFRAVAAHLGLTPRRERLKAAIRAASFKELRAQEQRHGFLEQGPGGGAFFRSGTAEQWREQLSPEQVRRVRRAHGETMRQHGYGE